MKSKDIAIVGIMLAIGAILRYFLAMLHTPLTPNMIIAFYCLAIILVKPKILEALGIGIVAGILSMMISSSMFPPGNLISEPLGALACFGLYAMLKDKIAGPAVTTFITTLVSGFCWVAVSLVAVSFGFAAMKSTMMGYMTVFVPIVVITGIFNAIIVQILFFPANRVLNRG